MSPNVGIGKYTEYDFLMILQAVNERRVVIETRESIETTGTASQWSVYDE